MDCTRCGACCVRTQHAPDGTIFGRRCEHLTDQGLCGSYETRPQYCRDYTADSLCDRVVAPTLDERNAKYLAIFSLAYPKKG